MPSRIAIIGAGIAGVSLARLLTAKMPALDITIFEKSRGVGGRMATRYTDTHEFDHGAQFFTVRTPEFESFLQSYQSGFQAWEPKITTLSPTDKPYGRIWFEPHYVGAPRMNSLCKSIALAPQPLKLQTQRQVLGLLGSPGAWYLQFEGEDEVGGPFDWVVSTAPAPQSASILEIDLEDVVYAPTFALMVPLGDAPAPAFDAAVIKDSLLDWVAVSSSRPGRDTPATLVAHASGSWSEDHLELPADEIKHQMLCALEDLAIKVPAHESSTLHRWRYARVMESMEEPFFLDSERHIAGAGDWCVGARVEDAFTSAFQLSEQLLPQLMAG